MIDGLLGVGVSARSVGREDFPLPEAQVETRPSRLLAGRDGKGREGNKFRAEIGNARRGKRQPLLCFALLRPSSHTSHTRKNEIQLNSPTPSGVTAPRPVTTTRRIACLSLSQTPHLTEHPDKSRVVWWNCYCCDAVVVEKKGRNAQKGKSARLGTRRGEIGWIRKDGGD